MPAPRDPCPTPKRTTLQQKGPDACNVSYGTLVGEEPLLDSSYAILHCAATLVGGGGRQSQTSSDSLLGEIGKRVGDGLSCPSVLGESQGFFPGTMVGIK